MPLRVDDEVVPLRVDDEIIFVRLFRSFFGGYLYDPPKFDMPV